MKCDRCGRDNPEDLRFCQDCGNRLQVRAAPPTPPRGVALNAAGPASESVRVRPPAPDFDFSPKDSHSAHGSCPRCGTTNPAEGSFCAECGAPLAKPAHGVVGAPVVGAAVIPEKPVDIVCPRCRGTNRPRMAFCQYCGARLDGDAPASTRPEPVAAAARASRPAPSPVVAAAPVAVAPRPAPDGRQGGWLKARLVVIAQDGSPGRDYSLAQEQTDIGRDHGAIQLPNDPYVSPRHARITQRGGRFFLRDLDSVNGVYLRLAKPHDLVDGDLVLVGLEVLRFETVSGAEKGYGPAMELGTQVFGSPASPRFARLVQRTVEGVSRDVHYLTRDETILGRESGDIVFTSDPFMSRRHAALVRNSASGRFTLSDLGSSNGTYVGLRGEHTLSDGEHVRVGQHLFRIEFDARASGQG